MSDMKWNEYEVSANVSLLFAEVPYENRFHAAADAGFGAVETWWPFAEPHPGNDRLDRLADIIDDAGVQLTALNFFAGDMPAGERGIACLPDRADELAANVDALVRLATATGCGSFNLLYGQLDDADDREAQQRHAIESYRRAADAVSAIGGTVLVEPLARGLNGNYPLHTADDVSRLIAEIGSPRVAFLLDTFHLGMNGEDVAAVPRAVDARIGHVQLADITGRGEPGSGTLDWDAFGDALRQNYNGPVAAEYKPTRTTTETLSWLTP